MSDDKKTEIVKYLRQYIHNSGHGYVAAYHLSIDDHIQTLQQDAKAMAEALVNLSNTQQCPCLLRQPHDIGLGDGCRYQEVTELAHKYTKGE